MFTGTGSKGDWRLSAVLYNSSSDVEGEGDGDEDPEDSNGFVLWLSTLRNSDTGTTPWGQSGHPRSEHSDAVRKQLRRLPGPSHQLFSSELG